MISYVKKYSLCGFRKININLLYTHNSCMLKKRKKKLNINIASIFITLTEINNETHYVANKIKKQKTKQTKNKTKMLRYDSHSQRKSAGVVKQRLYDHGYGTLIT